MPDKTNPAVSSEEILAKLIGLDYLTPAQAQAILEDQEEIQ